MPKFIKENFDKNQIIKDLLENPRIIARVQELDLTPEQIDDALPILIDMDMEDPATAEYLTTFYVTPTGSVQRSEELSELGKKSSFMNNIVTQRLFPVDFKSDLEFFRDEERKLVVHKFAQHLADKTTKGLYIYGDMGIGKTFITKRFAKKLAEEGHKVGIVQVPHLVAQVKSSFGATDKYETLVTMLKEVEYLFLDDIGAEAISTWFRDEFLFSILNERMDKGRTTFFTSNYSIESLMKMESRTPNQKYFDTDKAKRLVDRVRALAEPIALMGKNRRI